ncbi:MAG: AEC family transporter [Synergistes sp.]|nr:AEC family transporter [Synergistes sp.]
MLGIFLVLPLLIIIVIGNRLRAYGFYSADDIAALMRTLFYVILPPLLFRTSYLAGRSALSQTNLFYATTICFLLTMLFAYISARFFIHKGDLRRTATSVFASFRGNNVYLGLPVIQLSMGSSGMSEAAVYLAVTAVSFQLLSVAAGEIIMHGRMSAKGIITILKRLATNPLILSCSAGVVFALSGIHIHFVIDETLKLMGNAATAVALLALGGSLDLSNLGAFAGIIRRTWFDMLVKLALNPALMYLLFCFFPVSENMLKVTVMMSAMPTAVNCFILARGMGMDGDYAADLVASTTIMCIFAIPVWANILHMV